VPVFDTISAVDTVWNSNQQPFEQDLSWAYQPFVLLDETRGKHAKKA